MLRPAGRLMIADGVDQLFLRHVGPSFDADLLGLVVKLVLASVFEVGAVVVERSPGLHVRNPCSLLLGHAFIAEGFVHMRFLDFGAVFAARHYAISFACNQRAAWSESS